MQLPRYEKRPGWGYLVGHGLARGCLTSSFLINSLRLGSVALLIPQLMLLSGGLHTWWVLALGVLGFMGSWWMKATPPAPRPEHWNRHERQLSGTVSEAIAHSVPVTDAIHAVTTAPLVIDYGTLASGQAVCVDQTLRRAHQLITGGSGMGKSKFIATQAAQAAVTGASLVVVDPHEELAHDILCLAAPILADHGVILLWPDGPSQGVYPWNPLAVSSERPAWKVADSIVGAVKRVWQLNDANTYIVDVVKHTTWALAAAGWTLLEAPRFLSDHTFRTYITERADVPEVTAWVHGLDALSTRDFTARTQTSLVRFQRFLGNPHLKRFVGTGVTDPQYAQAYTKETGHPVVVAEDVGRAINLGRHVFAVLPRRLLGEDRYLVAGLVQSVMLEAVLSRHPNDPAMPETEAYLDEAAAYATRDGLGTLLAEARKYRFSAVAAMQGLHQADEGLQDELKTNTAIKVVFGTDHPHEADMAAHMLFAFNPLHIKTDARHRVGSGKDRHEAGMFQTYSPADQHAFLSGQIERLSARHYMLKVRGYGEPVEVTTPTYTARYALDTALRHIRRTRCASLVDPAIIDHELAWRAAWLERQYYNESSAETYVPALGKHDTPTANRQPKLPGEEAEPIQQHKGRAAQPIADLRDKAQLDSTTGAHSERTRHDPPPLDADDPPLPSLGTYNDEERPQSNEESREHHHDE